MFRKQETQEFIVYAAMTDGQIEEVLQVTTTKKAFEKIFRNLLKEIMHRKGWKKAIKENPIQKGFPLLYIGG